MLILWILIFIISLTFLVKGSDLFIENSEKIGLALKISPFIIGVTIVAMGTSLPELASSLVAVFKNSTEIVVGNIIGSNIFNILLIVGLSAIVARRLAVKRSLVDLDLPLLSLSTVIFYFSARDRNINLGEGIILLVTFIIYLLYTIFYRPELEEMATVLPSRIERRRKKILDAKIAEEIPVQKINFKIIFFWILGLLFILVGANYTINSLLKISEIIKVAPAIISAIALAAGTSLPELAVSIRAAWKKKYEISLGNIFGSNVFNASFIIGVSALFKPLFINPIMFSIGLPFLLLTTLMFVISGISQRIHIWEGSMYFLLYILFIIKLLGLF